MVHRSVGRAPRVRDLRSCWSGTEDGDYHHDNRNGGSLAARKATVSGREVIVVAHWEALS